MKLTEAIELGSMMGPQLFGLQMCELPEGIASCALGAAMLAVGLRPGHCTWVTEVFPSLAVVEDGDTRSVRIMVWNDHRELSRQEIAQRIKDHGWDCEAVMPMLCPAVKTPALEGVCA